MARSLRDAVELEDRGVRTVVVHTKAFRSAAEQHILSLGRPDYGGSVYLQHPVAALDTAAIESRVDAVAPEIVAALLGHDRAD
ncbi:MAG: hypothetical protein OXF79_26625 [Chloroflexi bacterium]|nr:hypothetical protein [Chloroflexota bacterium]